MSKAEKLKLGAEHALAVEKFVKLGGKIEHIHSVPDPNTLKPIAMQGRKSMKGRGK